MTTYLQQIDPILHAYLNTTITDNQDEMTGSNRLVYHLDTILATMSARLTRTEFTKAFPTIWENVFESFNAFVNESLLVKGCRICVSVSNMRPRMHDRICFFRHQSPGAFTITSKQCCQNSGHSFSEKNLTIILNCTERK
jgi:hypothetical protein